MPKVAHSFVVTVPQDVLWRELHDLEMVARCMPGVSLDGAPEDGRIGGTLKLKLGPISTSFAGTAEVTMDDATRTGVVRGQALDRKNNSRARSEIQFNVGEEDGASKVAVTVDFALSGALAQFSRGAIVQEVAQRLTNEFAHNLDAAIATRAPEAGSTTGAQAQTSAPHEAAASISVFKVLWSAFVAWLHGKFTGRTVKKSLDV